MQIKYEVSEKPKEPTLPEYKAESESAQYTIDEASHNSVEKETESVVPEVITESAETLQINGTSVKLEQEKENEPMIIEIVEPVVVQENTDMVKKRQRKMTKNGEDNKTSQEKETEENLNDASKSRAYHSARIKAQRKSTSSSLSSKSTSSKNEIEKPDVETGSVEEKSKKKSKKIETISEPEDSTGSESDEEEKDETIVLEDLAYKRLQPMQQPFKIETICSICEFAGVVINCVGPCQESFHLDCVGLYKEPIDGYKCDDCANDLHACFSCKKISEPNKPTKKCAIQKCGKYYHDECAVKNDLFRLDKLSGYTCPHHVCTTCFVDVRINSSGNRRLSGGDPNIKEDSPLASSTLSNAVKGRFVKCVRCPTAFHAGDHCNIPGSVMLSASTMICHNHFNAIAKTSHHINGAKPSLVNVSWCFVCCQPHDLIGCNSCPAAYHYNCIDRPPTHLLPLLNIGESNSFLNQIL